MKKVKTVYTCDLCNCEKTQEGQKTCPSDWVSLSVENPMLDRDWFEKLICEKCIKKIQESLNRSAFYR